MRISKSVFASRLALLTVVALAVLAMAPAAHAALNVTSGYPADGVTLKAAVRYRNFGNEGQPSQGVGNKPVWIGKGTFADNKCETDCTAGALYPNAWQQAGNKIKLSYDGNTLSTTVTQGIIVVGSASHPVGDLGALNYIQIRVFSSNGQQHTVTLSDVIVGSESITQSFTAPSEQQWRVTGANLTGGFTIEGQITLTPGPAAHGGGDSALVQLSIGYLVPPDTLGPITSNVRVQPQPVILNGPAQVFANVSDVDRGGSDILSADYSMDHGTTWASAVADDGTFDEVVEDVNSAIPSNHIGLNEVCVRGTDVLGNVGDATCQTFVVTYAFYGFLPPLNSAQGVVNEEKAGQAVAVKWRLTDYNGVPISDPNSFAGLLSYPVSCDTFAADPIVAITEVAKGNSGLQYLGDGYWQINWDTPKAYKDTCRVMYVLFDSTATSPHVSFKFK